MSPESDRAGTPTVPPTENGILRQISPTDISQFIRLEQCERYLRLRLDERSTRRNLLREYGVKPQSIPPLLTRSGERFEATIESAIADRFRTESLKQPGKRGYDNERVAMLARELPPREVVVLFQPRFHVLVDGWWMRGDMDILRLERTDAGELEVLIADMKSSTTARVEHRLQVAFYHEMLAALLRQEAVPHSTIGMAILYRGPDGGDEGVNPRDMLERGRQRDDAERYFGTRHGLLDLVLDPESYIGSVRDLVTAPDSTAARIASGTFEAVPYHLTYKCDGCLYNEFCMKWTAEHDDLSLLPHLATNEKSALQNAGINTMRDLVTLKEFRHGDSAGPAGVPSYRSDLVPAHGKELNVRELAAAWPVGPRLDELVHRARRYRRSKGDSIDAVSYIPSKGYGSLPYSGPDHNPNLVRVYVDAQHDYLHDRIYMLGSLVVACADGTERPDGRRSIVRLTDCPPDSADKEERLFLGWVEDTMRAIGDLAAPDENGERRAPIHLIFYNRFDQRLVLDGLARHATTILGATPLYDFITQLAAFDSPVVTFLDQEIRELKNYPMVCQSLQAVAEHLGFDWRAPADYRQIFRTRMFDYRGKLDRPEDVVEQESPWYTSRSRFNSQIPLEYAYAAWGALRPPAADQHDEFQTYRGATTELLHDFHARRLEALERVAADFRGNRQTVKSTFDLAALDRFANKADSLAQALDEFVTIERLVALADWKTARLAPPERRILAGETLLARYREVDQDVEMLARYWETERRRLLKERYSEEFRRAHPDAERVSLTREQRAETRWSPEGLVLRLSFDAACIDCDLEEALAVSTLRVGDRVVLCPRTTVDTRLPEDERTPFTPTPKQMLYGMRADITEINPAKGYVEVRLAGLSGFTDARGFVFGSRYEPLVDGELYTLDPDPNDWYGQFCSTVTAGLCAGEPNTLYRRLADPSSAHVSWPPEAAAGQQRFLEGLVALHAAGAMHAFEPGKHEYIGGRGTAPTLLVQGPPGTGKSYTTAWAILARIQGAMAAGIPYRVFVSCKTHAATHVLLEAIAEAREELGRLRARHFDIFNRYFDRRLLDVPLFRVRPRQDESLPADVTVLPKDEDREPGQKRAADRIAEPVWCVVAATPSGIRGVIKDRWPRQLFGHELCDCLVLDEASQMNLPESCMAALPLKPDGHLVVVGDHRQMPPIVRHDWIAEPRRTFQEYRSYESLFLTLRDTTPPIPQIRFEESFRLHADMAAFLAGQIYMRDGIAYRSNRRDTLQPVPHADPESFVARVLSPEHPLVVVVHDEEGSQLRNPFERDLMRPVLEVLSRYPYDLGPERGLGVVVPHRAQRAAFQEVGALVHRHPHTGAVVLSAADTVERFQGGERDVIVVSATESDPQYLLAAGEFLLEPRRLTVALSRARRKMVLVASRSVFSYFSSDEETFANSQLWKSLLRHTCTVPLWRGQVDGRTVQVWGNRPSQAPVTYINPA